MDHREFVEATESLLFSPEFQQLRAAVEFREPNIWRILDVSRKETWASRFLTWMLNPQAEHSFGDQFLKSLIVQTLQTEAGRKNTLTSVDVLVMNLSNIKVQSEYSLGKGRCDILAFSPEEEVSQNEGFLCIIENKIGAKEGQEQTKHYYEASLKIFDPVNYPYRVYMYLSPDGDPPIDEHFIPISYQIILRVIDEIRDKRQVTETEQFLLQQFQESIMRGITMDTKTSDLAQAVYDQYRDVFEAIIQHVDRELGDDTPIDSKWDRKSRFFNIGEMVGSGYRWEDCHNHNFICAGGAKRYRNWMEQIKVGDKIYAYVSKWGYVGVGTVIERAVPFREAKIGDQRLADLKLIGKYNDSEDDDACDWIAFVEWKYAVEKEEASRQEPIARLTTCRIYEHRKDVVKRVKSELAKKIS